MTTQEVTTAKTTGWQKTGYVQLQGGVYNAAPKTTLADAGIQFGGKVKKGGTFAGAQVGYGTSLNAKLEAGHEFDIGKNMGLELSANAELLRNNSASHMETNLVVDGQSKGNLKSTWYDGYAQTGIGAMLTFNGKKGNLKVGAEAGYRKNFRPDITHSYNLEKITTTIGGVTTETVTNISRVFTQKAYDEGAYITPRVEAEYKVNNHISFNANADFNKGNIGIRYTF